MIGLLGLYGDRHPEVAPAIADVIGKIISVAVVFGLQGQRDVNDIRLCEVTAEVCKGTEHLAQSPIEPILEVDPACPIRLAPDTAVPIALIVNELVTNALKHGAQGKGREPISVYLAIENGTAILSIRNQCPELPPGFDFEPGEWVGTGLALVHSLLPRQGAQLSVTAVAGTVTAELRLAPPVVVLSQTSNSACHAKTCRSR